MASLTPSRMGIETSRTVKSFAASDGAKPGGMSLAIIVTSSGKVVCEPAGAAMSSAVAR